MAVAPPGKEEDDGIVYEEEDEEGMAEFMEEYDELEAAEGASLQGEGPTTVDEYEVVEGPNGELDFRKKPSKSRSVPARNVLIKICMMS
jgi:hypothetical protein